jgi:mRNA-degrading endonuclease YafQ of YafQ-DinJ toxin-antitoxin module
MAFQGQTVKRCVLLYAVLHSLDIKRMKLTKDNNDHPLTKNIKDVKLYRQGCHSARPCICMFVISTTFINNIPDDQTCYSHVVLHCHRDGVIVNGCSVYHTNP